MTATTECGFEVLPHTPDMTPAALYLFPKLKPHLRSTQHGSNALKGAYIEK